MSCQFLSQMASHKSHYMIEILDYGATIVSSRKLPLSPARIPINKAPTDPISLQQLPLSHTQAYHQGTSLRISQGISAVKIAWPIHHSPTSSFISLSPPLSVVRTSIYPKMSNHICLSPSFTNLSFL